MSYDYGPLIKIAKDLVTNYGRNVQLVKLATAPADADKPWATPEATEVLAPYPALFVEPASYAKLGLNIEVQDFAKKSDKMLIIATEDDLSPYHKVLDGTQRWTIQGMTCLQPGPTRILWFVGVGG